MATGTRRGYSLRQDFGDFPDYGNGCHYHNRQIDNCDDCPYSECRAGWLSFNRKPPRRNTTLVSQSPPRNNDHEVSNGIFKEDEAIKVGLDELDSMVTE